MKNKRLLPLVLSAAFFLNLGCKQEQRKDIHFEATRSEFRLYNSLERKSKNLDVLIENARFDILNRFNEDVLKSLQWENIDFAKYGTFLTVSKISIDNRSPIYANNTEELIKKYGNKTVYIGDVQSTIKEVCENGRILYLKAYLNYLKLENEKQSRK